MTHGCDIKPVDDWMLALEPIKGAFGVLPPTLVMAFAMTSFSSPINDFLSL